jgi:hypothetical protein
MPRLTPTRRVPHAATIGQHPAERDDRRRHRRARPDGAGGRRARLRQDGSRRGEPRARGLGHDQRFCVRLHVKLGIWECRWTTFLKGGQITVQGPFYDSRNSELSITGGTGAYRGARGQMDLKSRNGGAEYAFIFQLM